MPPRAANTTHTAQEATPTDGEQGGAALEPHLILAFEADQPLAGPSAFPLGDLDEVTVGRGAPRRFERGRDGGKRLLRLTFDQAFMSSTHARLESSLGRWCLVDAGSKNGSLIHGLPVQRQVLVDGDVLELGRTFFVYRHAVPPAAANASGLTTMSAGLARTFAILAEVAPSTVSLVVSGEVGSGKEVIARTLHRLSRRSGPFVAVNCGALPAALVESELFGYKRGAFSGAIEDRLGLIRSADHGTLFLDEIGELSPAAQVTFLRVLQEREVVPVGATRAVPVDLRLVAATHRDLEHMTESGGFRADLLSRLTGIAVELPPLRERREDLGLLIAALLPRVAPDAAARISFRAKAARCLFRHDWPGNVRELEKCLGAAAVLARGEEIGPEHLPAAVQASLSQPLDDSRQRDDLVALMTEHGGNISAVSRAMGKAPIQIRRWLKRYALEADSFRK